MYDGGVVSGYEDGTFHPYGAVTRAQIAKIVVLAFGFPLVSPVEAQSHRFSDVAGDDPYAAYIATAASRGVVSGYGDGSYRPTAHVTRGQIAQIVVQVAGLKLLTPSRPSFSDVAEGSPFYRYVETAYAGRLISGYPDGTFRPEAETGRGQVCKIVLLEAQPPVE